MTTSILSEELNHKTFYNDLIILLNNILLKKITIEHCYSLIVDQIYYDKLNYFFFNLLNMEPYFLIKILESEDTLLPRYKIVKMLQAVQRTGCQLYIILLANGNQVERLLKFGDRYRIIDTRAKFILLYDNRLFGQNSFYLWRRIINVVFIKQQNNIRDENLKYGAWFQLDTVPFPVPIKKKLIIGNTDSWRLGKYRLNAVLFPDKTKNLKGELVNIAVLEHTPAIRKIYTSEGHFIFSGIEIFVIKVINTLSYSMNFSYNFYESADSEKEKWGKLQLNGSITGLLGEIINGRAEFALGDLHYTPYHLDKMDLTIPYNTECLTFLTPETSTDLSWKTLILPFKYDMWMGVLGSLFCVGFVFFTLAKIHIYLKNLNKIKENTKNFFQIFLKNVKSYFLSKRILFKKQKPINHLQLVLIKKGRNYNRIKEDLFDNFSNCILYTISMLLVVSLPRLPASWSIRLLTGWYWLYCLLVVVSYRASMTAILASPAPRLTIDTLRELSESKILCGAWSEQVREFFVTSLDDAGQKIGAKMEQVDDVDYAVQRIIKGEYAYYDNEYYLRKIRATKHINNLNNSDSQQLHIMKECAIHMPISIGLHKNSPIKYKIDQILRRIIEAGLINKWLNDEIYKLKVNKEMEMPKEALMNLKKFSSAFIAIGIGYLLSILSLLMEVFYFWKTH